MRDPYADLEINCRSQLTILEACRYNNPGVKVVFAGTRQVYGRPDSLPVDETHLVRPTDVNGINKAAGEYYHLVYNNVFGVRACSLRLTNVYGPRQLIRHNRQGFIGWFIRLAIEDGPSRSTATARSAATSSTSTTRPTRSCGGRRSTPATVKCSMSAATSRSAIATDHAARRGGRLRPRALRRLAGGQEGDRHRRLLRRLVEVPARRPAGRRRSPLRDGLARTIAFYRQHFDRYVDGPARRRNARDRATRFRSCRWRRAKMPRRSTRRSTA